MAMIDYGAIVVKNGNVVNEEKFFMDMNDSVGWKDKSLDGNYFAFIGDSDFTICFYKNIARLISRENGVDMYLWNLTEDGRNLNNKKVRRIILCPNPEYIYGGSDNFDAIGANIMATVVIKEIDYCRFHLSMDYKGDHYHVIYGYGIDCSRKVWDRVKNIYAGKVIAKKVDNLLNKIIKKG